MALISRSFLLTILPLLVLSLLLHISAAMGGRKDAVVGGWQPIKDPKDPKVVEIGNFAVTEHNKQAKTNLKFVMVVSGATQVVAGTNYKLIIAAKGGNLVDKYEAVVWDKPWEHFRNLTSFERVESA